MEYETLITDMEVRPYECDLQGIVNNSIYQNYFEYARYLYLKKYFNIDFAELGVKGKNIVVHRAEIDYKYPLKSGEKFYIKSEIEIVSKLKMLFKQNIYRKEDDKLICCGIIYGVCLNENGRPVRLSDYGFNYIKQEWESMDLKKNKKAVAVGVVIVCALIIVFFAISGNNTKTETANEVVKEKKVDNTPGNAENAVTYDEGIPENTENAVVFDEEVPGIAEETVKHENDVNLDDLINADSAKADLREKEEVPEKNTEVKEENELAKTDVPKKTEEPIKTPVDNYRDFKSPYINFTFNGNNWGYSFGKDMNISNNIVFPKRKPYILIEFLEKPDYKNNVILYVADADKMSDFAESKGNEPIDYVKYLFDKYSCKNLSIKETNKNKIVTGNISANNSTKTEKYYIISRHDLLFILISNNQNEKEKKLVNNIIDSI